MSVDVGYVTDDMNMDLDWWRVFLPKYNGVSIMWMEQKIKEDCWIASDSCLTGFGAHHNQEYIHDMFPLKYHNQKVFKIHHLEMLAVVVALRVWCTQLRGYRFVMICDNKAVVDVVNSGYTRDVELQNLLRELTLIASTSNFEVILRYVPSSEN